MPVKTMIDPQDRDTSKRYNAGIQRARGTKDPSVI